MPMPMLWSLVPAAAVGEERPALFAVGWLLLCRVHLSWPASSQFFWWGWLVRFLLLRLLVVCWPAAVVPAAVGAVVLHVGMGHPALYSASCPHHHLLLWACLLWLGWMYLCSIWCLKQCCCHKFYAAFIYFDTSVF